MKILVILLFTLLIALRFLNLGKIPVFIDEQTYLKLGKNILDNPGDPLLSLKYLVFPIVPWILGAFQFLLGFLANPLYLGRLIMVVADLISSLFIYFIAKKLINTKYAIFSTLAYLVIPLNFFHSRIILLEPITNMFFLAGLYFYLEIYGIAKITITREFISNVLKAACLFLLSFLSKPLALVCLVILPAITINYWASDKKRDFNRLLTYLSVLVFISTFVFLLSAPFIFSVWKGFSDYRVSPNFVQILSNFKKNLWLVWWWSKAYLSLPLIIAAFVSFVHIAFSKEWKILWVSFWLITAICLESLTGTNFLPRHLFLVCAPIALVIGYLISKIATYLGNAATILVVVLLLYLPLKLDAQIIFKPKDVPIALEDRQQFFEDWTSGEGLDKVAGNLKDLSQNKKIAVLTETDGGFGWSLENIYDSGTATIVESNALIPSNKYLEIPTDIINSYNDVYIVLNRNTEPPTTWPIKLIASYPKSKEIRSIKIYQFSKN